MFISASIVALAVSSSMLPPPCTVAPDGSAKTVVTCFQDACDTYQSTWAGCSNSTCYSQALVQYLLALDSCLISRNTIELRDEPWIVLWQFDGEFGFTFDNDAPVGATVYKF